MPVIYINNDDIRLNSSSSDKVVVNGSLGIGTTSPVTKLHVAGTSETSVRVSDSGGAYMELYQQATDSYILASNALRFYNGGSERMRITSAGNVGIGTTSPNGRLHVYGGRLVLDNAANAQTAIQINSAGTEKIVIYRPTSTEDLRIYTPAAGDAFSLTQAGSVGIGTTSPGDKLEVTGNVFATAFNSVGTLSRYVSGGGTFIAGNNGSTYGTLQSYSDTGGTGRSLAINPNGGNVGIGTTNPLDKLDVRGGRLYVSPSGSSASGIDSHALILWNSVDTAFTANALTAYNSHTSLDIENKSAFTASPRINAASIYTYASESASEPVAVNRFVQFNSANTTALNQWTFFQWDGAGTLVSDLKQPSKLWSVSTYESATAVEKLSLSGAGDIYIAGNVGIGTTSPSTNLHVAGSARVTGDRIDVNSNTRITGAYYENSNTEYTYIDMYNGGNASINIGTKHPLSYISFESGSGAYTERMRITNTGNVGVGTTSPGKKLVIAGASSELQFDSDSDVSTIASRSLGGASDKWLLINPAGGNVGIGTTSPTTFLTVSGQGNRTGGNIQVGAQGEASYKYGWITSTHYNATSEPEGFSLIGGLAGPTNNTVYIGGFIWESNPATEIVFHTQNAITHGTGGSERMRITSAGNVGIGTTSPDAKLHVASGKVAVDNTSSSTDVRYGGSLLALANSYSALDNIAAIDFPQSAAGSGFSRVGVQYKSRTASQETQDMFFVTMYGGASSEKMRILGNGNVGIGTTSPSAKLEVTGSVIRVNSDEGGFYQYTSAGAFRSAFYDNGSVTSIYADGNGSTPVMTFNAGNVGIGTTAPQQLLHILGTTNGYAMIQGANDSGQAGIYFKKEDTTGTMNRTKALVVFHTNVGSGWGRGHLGFCLNSADDNTVVSTSDEKFRMADNGDFHADGDVIAYSTTVPSDERLKDNIKTIENASEKIAKMRGVEYQWNTGKLAGKKEIGLIAQEVEAVIPEVVSEKKLPLLTGTEDTYKTVDYERLVALLIESNKELQNRITELESKVYGTSKQWRNKDESDQYGTGAVKYRRHFP